MQRSDSAYLVDQNDRAGSLAFLPGGFNHEAAMPVAV